MLFRSQLCRELLLLESSDWQFLITTGAARDYAESRFLTHNDQFLELKTLWEAFAHDGVLNEHMTLRLAEIEQRDNIFPGLDPCLWAAGSCDSRSTSNSASNGIPNSDSPNISAANGADSVVPTTDPSAATDPGDTPKSPSTEHGQQPLRAVSE